jgi:putative sugar O-methyltransferase
MRTEAGERDSGRLGRELSALTEMTRELEESPPVFHASDLWRTLSERNLEQLEDDGFDEFKRTVNGHYFQFIPSATKRSEQWVAVRNDFLRHPRPGVMRARMVDGFEIPDLWGQAARRMRRRRHAFYVSALWEKIRRRDRQGLLDRLEEPEIGHPVAVQHRGRTISEDLCNSAGEMISMLEGMEVESLRPGEHVVELGAGYGRLAWAFLAAFPGIRYTVVDIPPALAISQRYLTEAFPERRAFRFRRFGSGEEVREELERSEIAFLTPNQLDLLPPLNADLFATISSLHEMRPDQIAHYLRAADRHTAGGHFYFKQWESYWNPTDDVTVGRDDYPVPESWEPVYSRRHPIQTLFFEAMYRVPRATD